MDPNALARRAANADTEEEWLSAWVDYANWRDSGGFAAEPELLDAATARHAELLKGEFNA